jgi:hypothetical protein
MAEESIIIKVELDGAKDQLKTLNALQEEINALAQEKKKLSKAEKDLEKSIDETTGATEEQTATAKDLAEQQVQNNLILKETKQEFNQTEKAVLTNAKANKLAAGSVAQLAAQHTKDKDALRQLSKEERENTKEGRALTETVKNQSDELKELEKSYGTTSRSVGDYGVATQEVLPLLGGFGGQIQSLIGNLGQVKSAVTKYATAQKGMAASTKGSSSALKRFRIALISTGIGAIVVLLGSLLAAFGSTQRGADAFTKILRPLEQILQGLLGVAQKLATDALDGVKKAFENPRQAVIDLGNAIKDNFINRIKAIPLVVQSISKLTVDVFKSIGLSIKRVIAEIPLIGKAIDKDKLKKDLEENRKEVISSLKDFGSSTIQFQLGIDKEKQKEILNDVTDFVTGAVERGTEIDRLTKQIEQAAINLRLETERGNLEFVKQKEIVQNTLLTDQERLEAAQKAKAALEGVTKLLVDQQNREIELARFKTLANDTDRVAQKELQDLIADRERIEADAITKRIELGNQANGIVKTRIATDKKAVEDQAKADEKASKDKIKEDTKALDKKITDLELFRQLELATIDETNAQKIEKERELLDAIGALRVEKAKLNGEDVAEVELENTIAKAEKEKEFKEESDAKELEQEELKAANTTLIRDAAFQAGESFLQEAFTNQERRIKDGLTRETEALKLKRQAGEISEEEFAAKRLELEKKAFASRKRQSQAQNAIDFAVAAGKTIANLGLPLALPALGVLAIQKISQAAIISSQKFAHGGMINGPSHSQGGVPVSVGGSGMIEAEGGEAIINKRSTAKHMGLLSAINQDGGGVPLAARGIVTPSASKLSFGNGGVATVGATQSIDLNGIENSIASAVANSIGAIKVQNVASETTEVANRVQQIEDSASF